MAKMNKETSRKMYKHKNILSKKDDGKDASPKDGIRNGFKKDTDKITTPRRVSRQMKQGMY